MMNDLRLLGALLLDGQTDKQTFVIIKSLSRLKINLSIGSNSDKCEITDVLI